MGHITGCLCCDVIAVVATCLICIITYFKWRFKHWEKRNVPYIEPAIPFGTMNNFLWASVSLGELIKSQYEESKKKGFKHVGLFTFTSPSYMPIDVEYIKDIVSKEAHHFIDRGFYCNEKDDPLSAHLFALDGAKWKTLRVKLTPTFTSGKLKMMFHTLIECGKQLTEAMSGVCESNTAVNIKDIISYYGIDVIGSCAFGIDCDSFKNPDSDFLKYARRFTMRTKYENLKAFVGFANPSFAKSLGVVITPKPVTKFFMDIMKKTVKQRENNKAVRKDFLQILIDLKNNVEGGDKVHEQHLTIEELTAQAVLFLVAGFETSSTTITFCLYELAQNPEIQEKVRDEIDAVLDQHNGEITYEALKEMKYMKQVIDEVLRKYPPVPILNRKCVKDYRIPHSNFTIEEGTVIIVSVYGLHYDPEHFPNPETFDPQRFSVKNKKNIKPFTYMPFGEGPRVCIGLRFGLMQTGIGLTYMLKNFRFSLNKKTKLPLKMNPSCFVLTAMGDIWLNVEKI